MTSKAKMGFGTFSTEMSMISGAERQVNQSQNLSKTEYEKPVLIAYGDVRDITLGPTLGTTESGCAGVYRPGSGLPPGTMCPPGGN